MTFEDLTYPEDLAASRARRSEMLGGRRPSVAVEKRYVRKDGSLLWARLDGATLAGADGKPAGLIATLTDITERKRAEESLAQSLASLGLALQAAEMGVWHWDIPSDHRDFDKRTCRLLGLDPVTFTGAAHEFFDVLDPADADGVAAALTRTLERDVPYEPEYHIVWSDGSVHWIAAKGRLVRDDEGRPLRIDGVVWDVSERKQAEGALRASEERLRRAVQLAPVPVMIYAEDGEVIQISDTWTEITGYTLDEIPTVADWTKRAHREQAAAAMDVIGTLYAGERTGDGAEFEIWTKQGDKRIWHFRSTSLGDLADGRRTVISTAEDITARKAAEAERDQLTAELEERVTERTFQLDETISQLTEANEAKSHFLRSMSHELRTPLNSVIGFSSMLADGIPGEVNGEQERQLLMIKNSGRHLLALINDILDLSRVEAGAREFHFQPIELASLIDEVASDCRPAADAKDLNLVVESCQPKPMLTSDRQAVYQILLNLTSNAVKFTEAGGVVLRCSAPTEDLVAISVADTGAGIGEGEQNRIFGEFERGAAATPTTEGTGLGLAISLELATALGGGLEVDSEVGVGSTFTLTLPATPKHD